MSTADYKESNTRAKLIDPALYAAQWVEQVADAERDSHGEIHREQSAVRIDTECKSATCWTGCMRCAWEPVGLGERRLLCWAGKPLFRCLRPGDRDSHRMTAFRDWLYAQAGAEPQGWP